MSFSASEALWHEERMQRKQFLKRILIVGGIVVTVLAILFPLTYPINATSLPYFIYILLLLLAVFVSGAFLRADKLEISTHILLIAVSVVMFFNSFNAGIAGRAIISLIIPIAIASLLLSPRWTQVYTLLIIGLYIGLGFRGSPTITISDRIFGILIGVGIIIVIGTVLGFSSRRLRVLLNLAIERTDSLEGYQTQLEERVRERTASLQQALDEVQSSSETIRQLSVPLLPIADGVMLLALVGNISGERAKQIEQQVLTQVYERRPHTVLIDLSTIGRADDQSAQTLLRVASSLHLLGTESVLVGIHAGLAQYMVEQNIALRRLMVKRDLQQGLEYALARHKQQPQMA